MLSRLIILPYLLSVLALAACNPEENRGTHSRPISKLGIVEQIFTKIEFAELPEFDEMKPPAKPGAAGNDSPTLVLWSLVGRQFPNTTTFRIVHTSDGVASKVVAFNKDVQVPDIVKQMQSMVMAIMSGHHPLQPINNCSLSSSPSEYNTCCLLAPYALPICGGTTAVTR
jgi:hypothetical protein